MNMQQYLTNLIYFLRWCKLLSKATKLFHVLILQETRFVRIDCRVSVRKSKSPFETFQRGAKV